MGGLKGKKMIDCISIDNGIYEFVISIIALFRLIMEKNKEALLISNHTYNWHVRRGQRHFATLMPPRGFFSTLREPKFSGLA